MKPKFTPGPWQMKRDSWHSDHAEISSKDWGALALVVNKIDVQPSETGTANGHLIAAAPEMYDALLTIKRHIENMPLCDSYLYGWVEKNIDPLLAKARGDV